MPAAAHVLYGHSLTHAYTHQAVMELGASICTIHQTPACHNCPINGHCRAYQKVKEFTAGEGDDSISPLVTDYPVKV